MLAIGIVAGILAHLAYVALLSFFRIEEGHVGVLTRFGAAVRHRGPQGALRLYRPGLHLKLPWDAVHVLPLMEQIMDLSGAERARAVMLEDGTALHVDSILRFRPVESELGHFLFDLREPKTHIAQLFSCLLRNELANVRPPSTGEGTKEAPDVHGPGGALAVVRRERRRLNGDIVTFCQRQIGDVYGIQFSAVDLVDIRPPDELDQALNTVMTARSEADALQARVEGDCERRVIAARRGVEIARAKATASEREILGLAKALAALEEQGTLDLYIDRRRAEVLSQSRLHYVRVGGGAVAPRPHDDADEVRQPAPPRLRRLS